MARRNQDFQAIRSEGGLLPSDLLRRVIDPRSNLSGTKPEDYGLPVGERLNEVMTQSWNRLRRHWAEFRTAAALLPEGEAATGLTNDKWSLPLLRELGFGLLPTSAGPEINGRSYPISRFFGPVPVHLVGFGLSLDRRAAGQRGAAAGNPHGVVQEFLNRSSGHLWGIVSNGLRLRILRDSQSLSRQSFVEFDLEAILSGEIFADFVLLWLAAHATRFSPLENSRPETCWLEHWTTEAEEQGARALNDLRGGVEKALQVLGEGFTTHPRNISLREALRSGDLSPADFHGQLLRVVYRLIFLFVAEDRTLEGAPLLHPRDSSQEGRVARERYAAHYSTSRLRDLAGSIKGSRHGDLWRQFQLLVIALSGDAPGESMRRHLALPSLGSFLWAPTSTTNLNASELTNFDLLEALRQLSFTLHGKALRSVDYKNLGAEELGGVYESLLALTPQVSADGARFTFAEFAGNERKTSGSYYTPDSLVQCLLDSALDPIVEEAIKGKVGREAEKAILALKVCDPAVGSGHFLVGAAHRLARHLARVRALTQGDSEPSPLLYQHALRDVIGRCIYGVDLNPMAAELCRVSLWLEALEPGKPLSFLDHHIRVGNSLLGATPELIAAGLPDDAFTAIEGDDKKACAVLKKRNKAERKGLGSLFVQLDAEAQARLQKAAAALEELSDDRPEDIRSKEKTFRRHEETEEYGQKKLLADAWCSAFVFKKQFRESSASGITQGHLNDLASGRPMPVDLAAEVERLSNQYKFFHWHLSFPEVFAKGGFDCVLGNPPWERVKLQEQEWFAQSDPRISRAPNTASRKLLIDALKTEIPTLYENFTLAIRQANSESHFLRSSAIYPLCGRGDVNLFAVFVEGMRSRSSDIGAVGVVVPTALVTDTTTQEFFREILNRRELVSVFDFSNEKGLFPAVRRHQQFALLTLRGVRRPVDHPLFGFYFTDVGDLQIKDRIFSLSPVDVRLVNPNTLTAPIFRTTADALLVSGFYRRIPVLIREAQEGRAEQNPWGVRFSRLFDMANDSNLFRTREKLEADGWRLDSNVFRKEGKEYLPLFDAKMAQQYNHRAAELGHSGHQFRKISKKQSIVEELADPHFKPNALYYIPSIELNARTLEWQHNWFLGFKDITGTTSIRLASFSIIPRYGVGHPFPVIFANGNARDHSMLLAALNSLSIEYVLRQKLQGLHLTYYYLKQLPVPNRETFCGPTRWDRRMKRCSDWLLSRTLELTYSAWDLVPFAQDCGWSGPPFRWDEKRRFLLRCELDAAFFHLYLPADEQGDWTSAEGETAEEVARRKLRFATPRDAVAYIIETFLVIRRRDEREHGEYRTKRVILEIYDAMQEAIRTGQPYQTPLDPPPGPPIDATGNFVNYSKIAANPPPHIHLPREHAHSDLEFQLSDLARGFPKSPFIVRLGTQTNARRVRVTTVRAEDLRLGERVIFAAPTLRLHNLAIAAAVGKFGVESRSDASSGKPYVLVSVRGDDGVAQARLSEADWHSLRSIGRVEDLS